IQVVVEAVYRKAAKIARITQGPRQDIRSSPAGLLSPGIRFCETKGLAIGGKDLHNSIRQQRAQQQGNHHLNQGQTTLQYKGSRPSYLVHTPHNLAFISSS